MIEKMPFSKLSSLFRLRTEFIFFIFFALLIVILFNATFYKFNDNQTRYVLLSFDITENSESISTILTFLDSYSEQRVNATFFVTGDFAEKNPDIIAKLNRYEVACMGTDNMYTLIPGDQEDIIKGCKDTLAEQGIRVYGFKASDRKVNNMIYAILEALNFRYDASQIKHYEFAYPDELVQEISITTSYLIPLDDKIIIWKIKPLFYFLFQQEKGKITSVNFNPESFSESRLRKVIDFFLQNNRDFVSHRRMSDLLESHNM